MITYNNTSQYFRIDGVYKRERVASLLGVLTNHCTRHSDVSRTDNVVIEHHKKWELALQQTSLEHWLFMFHLILNHTLASEPIRVQYEAVLPALWLLCGASTWYFNQRFTFCLLTAPGLHTHTRTHTRIFTIRLYTFSNHSVAAALFINVQWRWGALEEECRYLNSSVRQIHDLPSVLLRTPKHQL